MASALQANGRPHPGAVNVDDVSNQRSIRRKILDQYPELALSPQVHFLILAVEEGGRWSADNFSLVRELVRLKAAPEHPLLRRSVKLAYTRRWWSMLSVQTQAAAADCILGWDSANAVVRPPDLATVLAAVDIPPDFSRIA